MVVVLILLGIVLCGLVAGLIMRPRERAAQDTFADGVRALAARTGWRPDRTPVPPLQATFVTLNDVLGSSNHHGIAVNLQLAGDWRGVPVRVLQLRYRTEYVSTTRAATMILVPRPVPGPSLTVRAQDADAHLPADLAQRLTTQTLFFTGEHLAAVFPGEMTQQDLTIATADLLADLAGRLR
ncbi:hypothetical protein GCM10017786_53260 [Amycolatopsis deserti]|uniref:Uncharacterized protein n=1 Tax=Amycolatopsis deserti TaxID=185696 RepID=A0ABQ3JCT9_9PSEU|nr:hypothetical protein [Amycolatopsis deserti]GHF12613.1 hypothetical protein GCM10017786_53260 [Amycolatopsis deserti]